MRKILFWTVFFIPALVMAWSIKPAANQDPEFLERNIVTFEGTFQTKSGTPEVINRNIPMPAASPRVAVTAIVTVFADKIAMEKALTATPTMPPQARVTATGN